ncbi:MAG: hypothetical protein ABIJ56_12270 [Pseudomonadota bacterium]
MNRYTAVCLIALFFPAVSSCALGWEEGGDAQDAPVEPGDPDSLDFTYDWLPDAPADMPADAPFDMPADAPVDTPASDCPAGQTWCAGACVSTASDRNNCGTCGNVCLGALHADPVCEDGECGTTCQAGWADLDGDGACESDCVPADEICNGIDDDCDTLCDDGFECCLGDGRGCTTSCSTAGTQSCLAGCAWTACEPPDETCNGMDDDCDTLCDEGSDCCQGLVGASCTNPAGVSGTRNCGAGCAWSACCAAAETCGNSYDDDCDTVADDGCSTGGDCEEVVDSDWGAGPSGCSAGNQRCSGGSCITCESAGGYFSTYCWFEGGWGETCTQVCSAKSGVVHPQCTWGADYDFCDVCQHFTGTSESCTAADPSGPVYAAYLWNECWAFFRVDGTGDCNKIFDWMKRYCACRR